MGMHTAHWRHLANMVERLYVAVMNIQLEVAMATQPIPKFLSCNPRPKFCAGPYTQAYRIDIYEMQNDDDANIA